MSNPVQFSRLPYNVVYYKDGVRHSIRRVPPPKQHDMLPLDIVELKEPKNADWAAGEEVAVRGINPHHPNTLQLQNDNGDTTFVPYFDLDLIEEVGLREGKSQNDLPRNNRYLTWP